MADDFDTAQPPYPRMLSRVNEVYVALKRLRGWVNYHRTGLNTLAHTEVVPDPGKLMGLTQFAALPVVVFYQNVRVMRLIREIWDQNVRDFDDAAAWNSNASLTRRRDVLYQAACFLRSEAVMAGEAREAKIEQLQREALVNSLSSLLTMFDKHFIFQANQNAPDRAADHGHPSHYEAREVDEAYEEDEEEDEDDDET